MVHSSSALSSLFLWQSLLFISSHVFIKQVCGFSVSKSGNDNRTQPPQRSSGKERIRTNNTASMSTGPKAESTRSRNGTRRRSTGSASRTSAEEASGTSIPFDPKQLTSLQRSNENAIPFDLFSPTSSLRIKSSATDLSQPTHSINENSDQHETSKNDAPINGGPILHNHFEQISLDDIFPNLNFSNYFFRNEEFREEIRQAMRNDIFYTTPAYSNLSPKVAAYMLDNDSSLQGSWNCVPSSQKEQGRQGNDRMNRLTTVLSNHLGPNAPTGDDFMMKIGELCGTNPSTHWIDIIGVKNRKVSHSWHQDSGRSYDGTGDNKEAGSRYTVMLGFPEEDEYVGTGVFSHAVKLNCECLAPNGHNVNEPVLFEGVIGDEYIVRPSFSVGKEILRYRDIDLLHSAPDVVYRKSVMRFM